MGRLRLGLLVACVALTTGGGVAWATGIAGDLVGTDGTISACVQRNQGQARIVAPGGTCRRDEQSLSWNQKGPQGDVGPQGAKGDKGEPGPPGPAGAPLAGSACTVPGGGNGIVVESIAADGAIAFRCGTPENGGTPGCAVDHAVASCDGSGSVVGLVCLPGWLNADGNLQNGCEQHAATPEICNGIDDDNDGIIDDNPTDVGPVPHGVASCGAGRLAVTCDPGYVDYDGIAGNGCEVSQTQIVECADGWTIVAPPPDGVHVVAWACQNRFLTIAGCEAGWSDANGLVADGCEEKF